MERKTETVEASAKRARTANDHLAKAAARLRFVSRYIDVPLARIALEQIEDK